MIVAFRETQAPMPPVYAGPIPSLARRVGMACVPAKREVALGHPHSSSDRKRVGLGNLTSAGHLRTQRRVSPAEPRGEARISASLAGTGAIAPLLTEHGAPWKPRGSVA